MTPSSNPMVQPEPIPVVKLRQFLKHRLPSPSRVVLATSGGADSVALVRAWTRIREERGDEILVATFDHQLRPESRDECQFVRDLAESLGIGCEVGTARVDLANVPGRSLEEAARSARYSFLVQIAVRWNANVVATAHTEDDQVETVLMAMLRGTGLSGLAGMRPKRQLADKISLLRPFLQLRRRDLQPWLDSIEQSYCVDPSNLDRTLTRNRLRLELLPILRERFNPKVDDAVVRLSSYAASAARRERRAAAKLLRRVLIDHGQAGATLDAEALAKSEAELAAAALRLLFVRSGWPRKRMGRKEYIRMLRVAQSDGPPACDLPGGFRVHRASSDRTLLVVTLRTNSTA